MLFAEEYREAEERLYKKGFIVENMEDPNNDCYEVLNKDGKVMIEYLSLAQLTQLSKMF